MPRMKYWNGSEWVMIDAANADTLAGNTLAQVRSGTTKSDVGLANVDNVKQLPIAGGTMTGALTLNGAPTADLHASTKKYVDDGLSGKANTSHTHTKANITDFAHTHTPTQAGLGNVDNVKQMPIAGGTFTGQANAQSNTAYTTAQIRNISMGTADPTGGNNGDIYLQYE